MQVERITVAAADIKRGDGLVLGRKLGVKPVQRVEKRADGRVTVQFVEGWGYGFDADKQLTVERGADAGHEITTGVIAGSRRYYWHCSCGEGERGIRSTVDVRDAVNAHRLGACS